MATSVLDITICGISEIAGCCDARTTHVISILDPGTDEPPELAARADDAMLRLRFHDVIEQAAPHDPPHEDHVEAILGFAAGLDGHEAPRILIHCHMGVSRSTAAAIILLVGRGVPAVAAVEHVTSIRPVAWPNLRMIEIADVKLGLGSSLVDAVRRHHARALRRKPELRDVFVRYGRSREVDGLDSLD